MATDERDKLIEQLQRQSGDHYNTATELRKCISRLELTVFGNGNKEHSVLGRLEKMERILDNLDAWIQHEKIEREMRQKELDKNNKRLIAAISIFGLVVSTAAIVVPLLTT